MKLIARDDGYEGQIYRDDAFVVFGRLIGFRGWYVLLNLRFIQKDVNDYIDSQTWNRRTAHCYYRMRFYIRRRFKDGKLVFKKYSAWDEVHN